MTRRRDLWWVLPLIAVLLAGVAITTVGVVTLILFAGTGS